MTTLVDRVERLLLGLGVVSGFATLLIILIVVADVGGRFLFNSPLHSGVEISELLMVTLVFLGLAAAQQERHNFALDIMTSRFPQWLQTLFELLGYLACLLIVVLLAWPSSKQAISSIERGEAGFGIVSFPLWPARVLLALGLWLLALQFLCDIYRLVFRRPRATAGATETEFME